MRLEEMKRFAAELEQGISTWENTCGYDINEELLPFLNLTTESEFNV
jgi:hypothetical protein